MDKTDIVELTFRNNLGFFSQDTYREIDQLQKNGQKLFRLPLIHPYEYEDVFQNPLSAFAGNPNFIDLNMLIEEGELTQEEYDYMEFGSHDMPNDYEQQVMNRDILLVMAYERSNFLKDPTYQVFAEENRYWLDDYALFMALKQHFDGASWYEWPNNILMRKKIALDFYQQELCFEVEFQKYLQFRFFQQYSRLKQYANEHGIQIIGEVPLKLNTDSADVWSHAELFSANSHVLGHALYFWKAHHETGFAWWEHRIYYERNCFDSVVIIP